MTNNCRHRWELWFREGSDKEKIDYLHCDFCHEEQPYNPATDDNKLDATILEKTRRGHESDEDFYERVWGRYPITDPIQRTRSSEPGDNE